MYAKKVASKILYEDSIFWIRIQNVGYVISDISHITYHPEPLRPDAPNPTPDLELPIGSRVPNLHPPPNRFPLLFYSQLPHPPIHPFTYTPNLSTYEIRKAPCATMTLLSLSAKYHTQQRPYLLSPQRTCYIALRNGISLITITDYHIKNHLKDSAVEDPCSHTHPSTHTLTHVHTLDMSHMYTCTISGHSI